MKNSIHVNFYSGYIEKYIDKPTIDANKHPDDQIEDLINLLKSCGNDKIDIYCNSPYVMFRLTLLFGYSNKNIPINKRLYGDITITNSHFEIDKNGTITEGKYYKGMMSDECLLNDRLGENNDLFSDLLELEDKLQKENNISIQ